MKYNQHIVKKEPDLSFIPAKYAFIKDILFRRNYMRLSPPPYGFKKDVSTEDNIAYYVWREVMFNVSELEGHHRFPLTAEFYLKMGNAPANYLDEKKLGEKELKELEKNHNALIADLNDIVRKLVAQYPKSKMQHTPAHWGRANAAAAA